MKAVEMKGIHKEFGDTVACDEIDFVVEAGEIHSLLGENGAGKSSLMKILFGLYSQDRGEIFIEEEKHTIESPTDAIGAGLGMIHQHFMLVDRLTVVENIIAGSEITRRGMLDLMSAEKKIKKLSEEFGLKVDPAARIEDISVGEQQRVEILKALYRDAEILILDEPTAVLTPQETERLFDIMDRLREDGRTIIFITHKLDETMEIADRITVLRDGRRVGTLSAEEASPEKLARMMVGREVILRVEKDPVAAGECLFEVEELSTSTAEGCDLKNIDLKIQEGEILGLAGVEGNGQLELEESLMALREIDSGQIRFKDEYITHLSTYERRQRGIAHIPSDRLKRGLIEEFPLEWNLILGSEWEKPFASRGILQKNIITEHGSTLREEFDIRGPGLTAPASNLSGGNQQKAIIARELSRSPDFILAAQPTRGVDVGAKENIHNLLLRMRENGKAILLISTELDELRLLSDRILVIYEGSIIASREDNFAEEELGMLMAGYREEEI